MKQKRKIFKKMVAMMVLTSTLIMTMAPNVAFAESFYKRTPVTYEGNTINCILSCTTTQATATTFSGGTGTMTVKVLGYYYHSESLVPTVTPVSNSTSGSPTQRGITASISAPSDYEFSSVRATTTYTIKFSSSGETYSGTVPITCKFN